MSKFLIEATYSAEGLRGLQKEKATARLKAVQRAVESLGGTVENMYFSLGEHDVIVLTEMPDAIASTALAVAVSATGVARTKTTPLLTVEEMDRALAKAVEYRAPQA